jgi:hypothetical protein
LGIGFVLLFSDKHLKLGGQNYDIRQVYNQSTGGRTAGGKYCTVERPAGY